MKARVPSRLAAAIAAMLLLTHCAQGPVGGSSGLVPSEPQEIEMGAQAHQAILKEYALLDNPALQGYVNEVGQRLARQSPRADLPWHFAVVDSPDVNAFSLPGGYVYLTRGILAYLNSEAELAAVISHEIGHVVARHGLRQPGTPVAEGLGSVLVPEPEERVKASQVQASTAGYGPGPELEADRLGARYLAKSGYRPEAMIDVSRVLKIQALFSTERVSREGRSSRTYHGSLDTHPDQDAGLRQAVDEAIPYAVADAREGRDDYLAKLAGVHFGDSPDQGVIRNNLLLHERLGLAIQFPQGWQIYNRPDRVLAMNPGGDALLELRQGPKDDRPLQTLQKGIKLDPGAHYDTGRLGGYPAAFAAGTQTGKPVVVTAVVLNGTQYLIAGMTRGKAAYDRERSALRTAINSFHAITPAEKKTARTYSLQLIPAQPGKTTMAALARQSPLGADAETQLRLMNGLYPGGEAEPGRILKIVQ